eukprot:TRINITY_DN81771_c0_g1_i1.p1 TRINITY_DN81771_c0_g1~~TRINITY_DN81771_c0_g1_i1.p1  ORF type:complete len:611 (+),score=93.16 TRINITY_DN81771_c0_g1_i1:66-1835(+)
MPDNAVVDVVPCWDYVTISACGPRSKSPLRGPSLSQASTSLGSSRLSQAAWLSQSQLASVSQQPPPSQLPSQSQPYLSQPDPLGSQNAFSAATQQFAEAASALLPSADLIEPEASPADWAGGFWNHGAKEDVLGRPSRSARSRSPLPNAVKMQMKRHDDVEAWPSFLHRPLVMLGAAARRQRLLKTEPVVSFAQTASSSTDMQLPRQRPVARPALFSPCGPTCPRLGGSCSSANAGGSVAPLAPGSPPGLPAPTSPGVACFTPPRAAVAVFSTPSPPARGRGEELLSPPPPAPVPDRAHEEQQADIRAALSWHSGPLLAMALLKTHPPQCSSTDTSHALHVAVQQEHLEAVQFLLQTYNAGEADVLLRERCCGRTPLFEAVSHCSCEGDRAHQIVDTLLRHGAPAEEESSAEYEAQLLRPLHLAVKRGCLPVVKSLLLHGASPNARVSDVLQSTPLHLACATISWSQEACHLIKLLLLAGADPIARNTTAETPVETLLPLEKALVQRRFDPAANVFQLDRGRLMSRADVGADLMAARRLLHFEAAWTRRRSFLLARHRITAAPEIRRTVLQLFVASAPETVMVHIARFL